MPRKYYNEDVILAAIFALVLGLRLFFAFQADYFDHDAYFNIRQISHIRQTGLPLISDDLSYGGRISLFPPLFHYTLAFFSLFMPVEIAAKILPNLFASAIVIISYLIAKTLTKSPNSSLLAAAIAGFIPVFFAETVNSVSELSMLMPLMFLAIYALMNIGSGTKYAYYFVASALMISLTHFYAFVLVFAFFIYLIFIRMEKLRQSQAEIELIIFFAILATWANFIIYKNAFLFHGFYIILRNTPMELLARYFTEITIIEALFYIGIIPFFAGIYTIYKYILKEKNRSLYLLISFAVSAAILLWARLIQLSHGLMFLGIIFALLFSRFYTDFLAFLEKTRIASYKKAVIALIIIVFIFNSIIPTISYTMNIIDESPQRHEISALLWLKENSSPQEAVLASLKEGHLITFYAQRKNMFDTNFLMVSQPELRLNDAKTIYTTRYQTEAIPLLNKYGIKYIMVTEEAKKEYRITDLEYRADEMCFMLIYDRETKIYESLCRME